MGSGFLQGSAQPDGKVLGYDTQGSGDQPPFGSVRFRGGLREQLGSVVFAKDVGQARVLHDGIAFTPDGQVLYDDGPGPFHTSMGGLSVNAQGAIAVSALDAETFLSAIGLLNSGLATAQTTPAGLFYEPLFQGIGYPFEEFRRDSQATYQDVNGDWRIALVDEPRFEERMLLMEHATVNKSTTYNANPDQALTGLSGNVTITRVYHPERLARGGLTNVCQSGYLINVHNPTAGKEAVVIAGQAGNTNPHVCSIFLRTFGPPVDFGLGVDRASFKSNVFTRAVHYAPSPSPTDTLNINLDAGESVQFVLAQLEEGRVVSSPIITEGMTANRAEDMCRWGVPIS